jgi:yeast amino acid transporter
MISIGTAGGLINYLTMAITYVHFHKGLSAQGIDRSTLPYKGWGQPYLAWVIVIWYPVLLLTFGYTSFLGPWDNFTFFSYYMLTLLAPVTYGFWKLFKRTKVVKPGEMDLLWARPAVDMHEASLTGQPIGFWREMGQLVGIGSGKGVKVHQNI